MKKHIIVVLILFVTVAAIFSLIFSLNKDNLNEQVSIKTTENNSVTEKEASTSQIEFKNIQIVFMRLGEIWVKDVNQNIERKISKEKAVSDPFFSPNGKFVGYYSINRAGDGFPTSDLYISANDGEKHFIFPHPANYYGSKLLWSEDEKYVGVILFPNASKGMASINIYSLSEEKLFYIGETSEGPRDKYNISETSCDTQQLSSALADFCHKYLAYIREPRGNASSIEQMKQEDILRASVKEKYQMKDYNNDPYIKVLDNGLISAMFYKGKPSIKIADMEAYIPGYDPGVTQTYTLLLSSDINTVLVRIENAVDADFFFEK